MKVALYVTKQPLLPSASNTYHRKPPHIRPTLKKRQIEPLKSESRNKHKRRFFSLKMRNTPVLFKRTHHAHTENVHIFVLVEADGETILRYYYYKLRQKLRFLLNI